MPIMNILFSFLTLLLFKTNKPATPAEVWQINNGGVEQVLVLVGGYLSHSTFDVANKKWVNTRGGTFVQKGKTIEVTWQYDYLKTNEKLPLGEWLGKTETFSFNAGKELLTNINGKENNWKKAPAANGSLTGVWRITGRKQNGEISEIPLRDRRTLKIMAGNRFQWVAFNLKTGEFAGTGGGYYTFDNGVYTEKIDFFSRNAERVGAELKFEGKIVDGKWHHSGNSSSGEPIFEIWSKLEQ